MLKALRRFLSPPPELPPEAPAMASHFKTNGIDVEPRSLKPRRAGLDAVFEMRIAGYPLSIVVLSCVDVQTAERFVRDAGGRARAFPRRNGRLVMMLPYWEAEDSLTEPVINAFLSFRAQEPRSEAMKK